MVQNRENVKGIEPQNLIGQILLLLAVERDTRLIW